MGTESLLLPGHFMGHSTAEKKAKEATKEGALIVEVRAILKFTQYLLRGKFAWWWILVRGKDVNDAINILTFLNKKSALIIKSFLQSAVANADQKKTIDVDTLFIKAYFC